ncbi:hypothetical protein [Psychromicrobium lacuslunae]|uniref:Uncharacterized protein n=1 Tax=Psychromicrobium lacuslunae TaxID=1618207 RepID=A0A0D4BZ63_9MICC|nr:hypothetical protein [Psychromicrobium lacuslunae]AJT41435.1 hypothetical protein UM93_07730 [Psychromicrobium lacuslunae]
MRWEALFNDLLGQLDAAEQRTADLEIDELFRAELVSLKLMDRLRAALNTSVSIVLSADLRFSGELRVVGADWLLLSTQRRSVLLPVGAISHLEGLSHAARPSTKALQYRFASALRVLSQRRAGVHLLLGSAHGSPEAVQGVIDRVAADHCDISALRDGEFRREGSILGEKIVPFTAILAVSSLPVGDDGGL